MLRHCGPDYAAATWPTAPAQTQALRVERLSRRLDYAFATPDIAVIDAATLDVPASDHRPILLVCEV